MEQEWRIEVCSLHLHAYLALDSCSAPIIAPVIERHSQRTAGETPFDWPTATIWYTKPPLQWEQEEQKKVVKDRKSFEKKGSSNPFWSILKQDARRHLIKTLKIILKILSYVMARHLLRSSPNLLPTLPVCLSICLSVFCLSVCLSVCVSVCLSLSVTLSIFISSLTQTQTQTQTQTHTHTHTDLPFPSPLRATLCSPDRARSLLLRSPTHRPLRK